MIIKWLTFRVKPECMCPTEGKCRQQWKNSYYRIHKLLTQSFRSNHVLFSSKNFLQAEI